MTFRRVYAIPHRLCSRVKSKYANAVQILFAEFSAYRWNEKLSGDVPVKENDHAMDDMRYFVNTVLYHQGGFFAEVR